MTLMRGEAGAGELNDPNVHPHDLFVSVVTRRLGHWRRPDLLDIGCGWHFDWPWEHEREKQLLAKAEVTGIDPDWQAMRRHRTIERRVAGMVESLPFSDESFDVVTANVVVEHLKQPALAFAEIFRVLRSEGVFVFRTPSARNHFVRVARLLPQRLKIWLASGIIEQREPEDIYPAYYRANTAEEIAKLCKEIGFRSLAITMTQARGILARFPRLATIERASISALGMTEGNIIVEAFK